jgi:hypothetical protein
MAKLKKAPGRIIGRWKHEAITANPGASNEDLAKVINDMAVKQGYDYKIAPEKVRSKTKKRRGKRAAPKPAASPAAAAQATRSPAPRAAAGALTLDDVQAVKDMVGRIGADKVRELAGMLAK